MKTYILTSILFIASLSLSWADTPAIKIVEHVSLGDSKDIASISSKDASTRAQIIKYWEEAKKAFPKDRRNMYGPSSGYVEITLTNGEEEIVVRSWHPLYEDNTKVVVTSNGVESLEGRNRDGVLKADKKWYREARRVFDSIVRFTKAKAEQAASSNP
jgi:hypothetical protein